MNWDEIRNAVEDAIINFETSRQKGELGNGMWHYLRVYPVGESVRVLQWCEASRMIPESEYYRTGKHPVTIYSVQETYHPGPDDGLEWVDDPDGNYIRNPDRTIYHVMEYLDDDEIADLLADGWVRFSLGDPVDPPDVDELVSQIMDDLREKWGDAD